MSSSMVDEWNEFSAAAMTAHIESTARKYTLADGVKLADILPWHAHVYAATKYCIELVMAINTEDPVTGRDWLLALARENLLKIAHSAQLAYSRLPRAAKRPSWDGWEGEDV